MLHSALHITTQLGRNVIQQRRFLSLLETWKQPRLFSTEAQSDSSKPIFAACVLERLPVVVPDDLRFEIEYQELKERLFKRYRQPVPDEFALVRGGNAEESTEGGGQAGFSPAPRTTDADEANDTTSLRRALDKRLFLLIKARGEGNAASWGFPQAQHLHGETVRQTAERALAEALTEDEGRQVYFVGNSPAGHGEEEEGNVFFHRAQLIKGDVAVRPQAGAVAEHAWVTKAELPEYITDENAQMLFKLMLCS